MDQFDVEESPGCTEARLVVAQRSYCGSIASGAHSESRNESPLVYMSGFLESASISSSFVDFFFLIFTGRGLSVF